MKEGKKILGLLVLLAVFIVSGTVWAANPSSPATAQILSGNPITIAGKVKSVPAQANQGLEVETPSGVVTIYGIGPRWFWSKNGVAYPNVGDEIEIEGMEVTLADGSKRIVATKITVNGKTILLRSNDGRPLWRGGPNRGGAKK